MTRPRAAPALLLASASPRRAALLRQAGIPFTQRGSEIDESRQPGEAAADYTRRLALAKARAAAGGAAAAAPVLGADTVVVQHGRLFGKPRDEADFHAMFSRLAGGSHSVLTAVALCWNGREAVRVAAARVWLRAVGEHERAAYWATGEPRDKAGGYGAQGLGGTFVTRIEGSYSAVVGLPLAETEALLRSFGIEPWGWRAPDARNL